MSWSNPRSSPRETNSDCWHTLSAVFRVLRWPIWIYLMHTENKPLLQSEEFALQKRAPKLNEIKIDQNLEKMSGLFSLRRNTNLRDSWLERPISWRAWTFLGYFLVGMASPMPMPLDRFHWEGGMRLGKASYTNAFATRDGVPLCLNRIRNTRYSNTFPDRIFMLFSWLFSKHHSWGWCCASCWEARPTISAWRSARRAARRGGSWSYHPPCRGSTAPDSAPFGSARCWDTWDGRWLSGEKGCCLALKKMLFEWEWMKWWWFSIEFGENLFSDKLEWVWLTQNRVPSTLKGTHKVGFRWIDMGNHVCFTIKYWGTLENCPFIKLWESWGSWESREWGKKSDRGTWK